MTRRVNHFPELKVLRGLPSFAPSCRDRADSLQVLSQGGIVHTFTEVRSYGQGDVAEWNQAVPNDGPAINNIAGNPVGFADFGCARS